MSLSLYMDVHVPRSITRTLTAAGVDVIPPQAVMAASRCHTSDL